MRKGLSPLVATLVLIAFTVIGGMLVYEYFARTSETIMSSGDQLIVTAYRSALNSTRALVQVDVVNGFRNDVTISGIYYLGRNGELLQARTVGEGAGTALAPGAKHSYVLIVPAEAKVVIIEYRSKEQVMRRAVNLG